MKIIKKKLNSAKKYMGFINHWDNFEVNREEVINDIKASVFLTLNEAIIQKYLELHNNDNKILQPMGTQYLTKAEFTEFVGFICMRLNAEVDALKINTKVNVGSKISK